MRTCKHVWLVVWSKCNVPEELLNHLLMHGEINQQMDACVIAPGLVTFWWS